MNCENLEKNEEIEVLGAILNKEDIEDDHNSFDFDTLLGYLGGFGRYQMFQYTLMALVQFLAGCIVFEIIFLSATPDFECSNLLPEWNDTQQRVGDPTIAVCAAYTARNESGCSGFNFSQQHYSKTIVTEWSLVCNYQKYVTTAKTMFFVGRFIGSGVCGMLSDRFGRHMSVVLLIGLVIVSGAIIPFSPNIFVFTVGYFLRGAGQGGMYVASSVLGTELLAPKNRKLAGVLFNVVYIFGFYTITGLSYSLRDWRLISGIMTCPAVLMMSYIWLVEESPRWLISQGKIDKAILLIRKISRINKVQNSEGLYEAIRLRKACVEGSPDAEKKVVNGPEIRGLCGFWAVACQDAFMFSVCCIVWAATFSSSLSWYGLAFNQEHLHGNPYINFILFAISQTACFTANFFLIDRVGRRILSMTTLISGGIICLCCPFIPAEPAWLTLALTITGQFLIGSAYTVICFYAVEIFPTSVRNMGFSVNTMMARIAGGLAPLMIDLRFFYLPLPHIVFGVLSLICGILIIRLPETAGRPLPESVDDLKKKIPKKKVKHVDEDAALA